MTIMNGSPADAPINKTGTPADAVAGNESSPDAAGAPKDEVFGNENLGSTTVVAVDDGPSDVTSDGGEVVITPEDKIAFLDAVVGNSRFEKDYAIFGGRIKFRLRSLTSDESQAIASWILKQGAEHPRDQLVGRYLKYVLSAQVAKYNGVEMPPLEQPLFETLGSDGKTVGDPGWIGRSAFWDEKGVGVIQAMRACLDKFDKLYSTLCSKAEDENFWNPDTP